MIFGRCRTQTGGSQEVSRFLICLSQPRSLEPHFAVVCSAQHKRLQRGVQEPHQVYLPSCLFAGCASPPLESDWPLALDWNWLHEGYNNERLWIFWSWQWRSVNGWDAAVTRTTRFYINVLSSSQIPEIRLGLWSQRYCAFNWVVLIHAALVHDCTLMMKVRPPCSMKNWGNHPNVAWSSAGLSDWRVVSGSGHLEKTKNHFKRHHDYSALMIWFAAAGEFQASAWLSISLLATLMT